jgi:uncharacterized protein YbjT (DUF2867 family)
MTLLVVFLIYSLLLSISLKRAGAQSTNRAQSSVPAVAPVPVLIVGATGGTGRMLVAQALERGYIVTALVRNPSALDITHPQLQIMTGNVLDEESLNAALRGQDAVVCALGHKRYLGPTRILSDGTRNLLRVMSAHGVRRFVCETSLGIGSSAGRMGLYYTFFVIPVILPFYFWDKARQERIVAAADLDWVIVRPAVLTNGPRRGGYRYGARIGSFLWTHRISRADVADFMLNQLASDTYLRTAPGVCW